MLRTIGFPVGPQHFQEFRRQNHEAVLPSLTLLYSDLHPGREDVGGFELTDFAHSQSRRISGRQQHPMLQVQSFCGKKLLDLFQAVSAWANHWLTHAWQGLDQFVDGAPNDMSIEKPEGTRVDNYGSGSAFVLADPVQQVLLEFLVRDLVWLTLEVPSQFPNHADVAPNAVLRKATELHFIDEFLSKCSHKNCTFATTNESDQEKRSGLT
jgi:hypothetical protein